jgi:photoactive yellow protein
VIEAAATPLERASRPAFDAPGLREWLNVADTAMLDALPFGLIAMHPDGVVAHYNLAEAALSGLTPKRVVGRNFFSSVAPCTNNFMVAHRFHVESQIDDIIDYVFTLRIAPVKVRLRLMKQENVALMHLAVEKRA